MSDRHCRLVLLTLLLLGGCSSEQAIPYQVNSNTTLLLRDNQLRRVSVAAFDSKSDFTANPRRLTVVGHSFQSPYEDSFAVYVATALRTEFSKAGCYDPASNIVVSGTVLANSIDHGGAVLAFDDNWSTGMTVRFLVQRDGHTAYDKTLASRRTWVGTTVTDFAIPRAAKEHLAMVQQLVRDLAGDRAFVAATQPGARVDSAGKRE